ncbi:DUF5723 family protein [Carboxylicivirga sp. N1Y90]|uniref:DUF5723 family protein n=1 Tax=Carboxylicivirga fragile TaxID=3417571 RepID=UPI003D33A6AB|nr:hypothetical protein [Marinilabiliaceae bacterium N1Y90]
MNKTFSKQLILLILTLVPLPLLGQQNLTLFLMHDLPQANFVNPAVAAKCPTVIGFPGLASIHANYSNTAFTLQDILATNNDSLYFNPSKAIDQMKGQELVAAETHYTPIYFGRWIKQSYFTFSITEKVISYNTINSDAAKLAWYGNSSFLKKEASLKGIRGNGNHYREYALGIASRTSDRMRIGIKAKLLFGKGNVYMPKTEGSIRTNERNFQIYGDLDTKINSSFPIDVETDDEGYVSGISLKDNVDWMAYMMNRRNLGFAIDFGFIYELNEKTTLSGSMLDLGLISWKTDVHNFESRGSFLYKGTGDESDFNNPNYFEELRDSFEDEFEPIPSQSTYISRLVPQVYLGATHTLNKHLNAGVVVRNEVYRNKSHSSLTLSANTMNYKKLNGSVSYSVMNGSYLNFGAGIGAKLGAVHIHAISDNLLAFTNLSNTRNANLRIGISIIPACDPSVMKPKSKNGISALPCYISPYKSDRKKKRRR